MSNNSTNMEIQKRNLKSANDYFEVEGAGEISISKKSDHRCSGVEGFSFGVSWGKFGYSGGVLSKEQARRLALFILKQL